jgi:hypothetical protein
MMNEYKEKVIENVKFSSEKIENASSENASQITCYST